MAYENRPPRHGPDNCNNGLSGGQILLIILACLLVIGLIAALIAWLMQDRRKNKSSSKTNSVIIGQVPQNNIQQPKNAQNQQTPNTNQPANQPAAPVMQNNVVQPVAQNSPALADTAINQQELINNIVAAATPQIMASMAQIAAQEAEKEQLNQEAVPAPEKETENEKEETTNKKSDDSNLQEPKTEEKKSEDIDDEEEKRQQKLEQSDLENLGLKAFAGRLTNPFGQLPLEKEIDNINYLKEQRKQEQAQQENAGNNITSEKPKLDFASLLGLPTKQNEQKKMDNMTGSQEMPQTINFGNISGSGSPEMKAGGGIDMLNRDANVFTPDMSMQTMNNDQCLPIMTQNKSTEPIVDQKEDNNMMPSLFNFMPPAQNDNQTINKENHTMNIQQLPNNMVAFGEPQKSTATTRMPLSIIQPNQIDNIPLANNEPVELFNGNKLTGEKNKNATSNNMMPFIMPEQNTRANNVSDNVQPQMMAEPIKENNVNYNGPLNANMMPPMEAMGSPNVVPNKPVMSDNPMLDKPRPINEDEIKPDAPIFTPPMMKMADNNEPKMQEEMKPPFILQSPKEKSDIEELPIPMQVNAQSKEQDKNSKEANESSVVNPFMQPAQPSPNVPVKKENSNSMFSELPGIDGKPMEANNEQSQMNLGTQNKCMCPSCTGNQ